MVLAARTCKLCLAILINNEECHFSRSTICLGQTYACMCYDYVLELFLVFMLFYASLD